MSSACAAYFLAFSMRALMSLAVTRSLFSVVTIRAFASDATFPAAGVFTVRVRLALAIRLLLCWLT